LICQFNLVPLLHNSYPQLKNIDMTIKNEHLDIIRAFCWSKNYDLNLNYRVDHKMRCVAIFANKGVFILAYELGSYLMDNLSSSSSLSVKELYKLFTELQPLVATESGNIICFWPELNTTNI